eukprot:TRINITY_DN1831_c0_g1_i1.p1 TRINITY_DN1831_c0_g1~~TRINITY_DN1831_c0_g1_i1.p1  ORF type:complete len:380 (+),score=71.20 TRINITY_DN1831_c0_g1_i1:163-1140(+)
MDSLDASTTTFCQNSINSSLGGGTVQEFSRGWADPDALQVMGQGEQLVEAPCHAIPMDFRSNGGRGQDVMSGIAGLGSGSCAVGGGGSGSGSGSGSVSDQEGLQGMGTDGGNDMSAGEEVPPNERKRLRRMYSNRESAKRSRLRRQELLHNLEVQVAELRVEKIALMKKFESHAKQSLAHAEENKQLKAEVLALRKELMCAVQCPAGSGGSLSETATSYNHTSLSCDKTCTTSLACGEMNEGMERSDGVKPSLAASTGEQAQKLQCLVKLQPPPCLVSSGEKLVRGCSGKSYECGSASEDALLKPEAGTSAPRQEFTETLCVTES